MAMAVALGQNIRAYVSASCIAVAASHSTVQLMLVPSPLDLQQLVLVVY